MTDRDDRAVERDLAAEAAGQDLEAATRPQEQEPHGCLGARDNRRKALDGSPLGEPVLDWSGITISTQPRTGQTATPSWSWG